MNSFTLEHLLLWKKYTNTYANNNSENNKWLNKLLIATSTDALNMRVNEKFELLPILDEGGIVHLKIMICQDVFHV